ncbi:5920_t:CDS:2 [Funneliformis geosporum]|nr:5920_t:CDS:2 [Funneliformis geosporum]
MVELEDDNNSLYCCVLVNKSWCSTAVQILWKNPWEYCLNKTFLFNTIISFLPHESREFLKSQGIYISLPSRHNVFNYLLFIKHLEATAISSMICDGISYSTDKKYHQFILEEEIYKLLMSRCSIKSLELDHIKHQIHHFPGAFRCLTDLVELNTNSSIPSEIFFGLSQICKRIKKIYVYFDNIDDENYGFIKLIHVQQNLKRFICSKSFDNNNDPSEELGLALTSSAQTLINLESRFKREIFLPPKIFPLFRNLKILQLLNDFLNDGYEEQLQVSSYPNLEILYIKNISPYTISKIIQSTTGKLRKILIQYSIGDYSSGLIQSIIENFEELID